MATTMQGLEPERRFRHQLREETHVLHERLDSLPALKRLGDGTIDLPTFIDITARFQNYYVRLDPLLEQASAMHRPALAGFSYAPRAGLLAGDLAALSSRPDAPPRCDVAVGPTDRMPAIDNIGALLGVLYVIEGSVLGGAVLEPRCRDFFPTEYAPSSYWAWCRRDGPARWKATVGLLDGTGLDEAGRQAAVAAARETFATLSDHMVAPVGEARATGSAEVRGIGPGPARRPGEQ